MTSNLKEKLISIVVFIALLTLSGYFLMNHHFSKTLEARAFTECISVVGDESSNWVTRRETIDYCSNQIKELGLQI